MIRVYTLLVIACASILLVACAGSATHEVVATHQANDETLTCGQIDAEIVNTQAIIDGVNQDKEDISGSDLIDGLLWFPFNLIAKSNNYESAMEAADGRIQTLQELRKEKQCAVASNQAGTTAQLASELRELNTLYKEGALTEDEYKKAKTNLLDNMEK